MFTCICLLASNRIVVLYRTSKIYYILHYIIKLFECAFFMFRQEIAKTFKVLSRLVIDPIFSISDLVEYVSGVTQ